MFSSVMSGNNKRRAQFWPDFCRASNAPRLRQAQACRGGYLAAPPYCAMNQVVRGSHRRMFPHLRAGASRNFIPRPARRPLPHNPRPSANRGRRVSSSPHPSPSNSGKPTVNPTDPLNLQGLMIESELRRSQGLPPPRGDSCLNTPALSNDGEVDSSSAAGSTSVTVAPVVSTLPSSSRRSLRGGGRAYSRIRSNRHKKLRVYGPYRKLPETGNYPKYYSKRDNTDRLEVLMPQWFEDCVVADYGCHNGTLTFAILEKYPSIRRLDAFDSCHDLIENAKTNQRSRLTWHNPAGIDFGKITFHVADWCDGEATEDEPTYNTVIAFSVTKWIHLNYGDEGLMRFFRRVFNLLKPGGHLLLEPQPKRSYKRNVFTTRQVVNFKKISIDPSNLEPILLDIGFSYFDYLKIPNRDQPFQRTIILCSKSCGATPSDVRNVYRESVRRYGCSPVTESIVTHTGPPPIRYSPGSPDMNFTPTPDVTVGVHEPRLSSEAAINAVPDPLSIKIEPLKPEQLIFPLKKESDSPV